MYKCRSCRLVGRTQGQANAHSRNTPTTHNWVTGVTKRLRRTMITLGASPPQPPALQRQEKHKPCRNDTRVIATVHACTMIVVRACTVITVQACTMIIIHVCTMLKVHAYIMNKVQPCTMIMYYDHDHSTCMYYEHSTCMYYGHSTCMY